VNREMEGKDVHENNQQLFQKMMSKLSQGRKIKNEKKQIKESQNKIQIETPSPIIKKTIAPLQYKKNELMNKRKTPPTIHEELPKSNKRKKHVT
jgi:hypothetical protein